MGRKKYLGMERQEYKRSMYGQVHTYLAQGIPYKQALKRTGTTDKVFKQGRALFHKANPQTPTKAIKTPGKREYTLRPVAKPRKEPLVFPTAPATKPLPAPGPEGAPAGMGSWPAKAGSVEKWFKKQDTQFIKDKGQLKLFLNQKFNPAFAKIVYHHYKDKYPDVDT